MNCYLDLETNFCHMHCCYLVMPVKAVGLPLYPSDLLYKFVTILFYRKESFVSYKKKFFLLHFWLTEILLKHSVVVTVKERCKIVSSVMKQETDEFSLCHERGTEKVLSPWQWLCNPWLTAVRSSNHWATGWDFGELVPNRKKIKFSGNCFLLIKAIN